MVGRKVDVVKSSARSTFTLILEKCTDIGAFFTLYGSEPDQSIEALKEDRKKAVMSFDTYSFLPMSYLITIISFSSILKMAKYEITTY
ncbi:hypothetical protein JCM16418A_42990 [Paenibacillus pini]